MLLKQMNRECKNCSVEVEKSSDRFDLERFAAFELDILIR